MSDAKMIPADADHVLQRTYKDNGDGTYAELVAASGGGSGSGLSDTVFKDAVGQLFIYRDTGSGTPTAYSIPAWTAYTPVYPITTDVGSANGPVTNMTLTAGSPLSIDLRTHGGAKVQISGLLADSLLITQSPDGIIQTTAYVMKSDGSLPTSAAALTGSAANGIYSVYGFAGELQFTRTGSADTLTVKVWGTN